jgi:hypothetical protein
MQRLNQLWQLAGAASNAAAGLRDLTLHTQTYTFWVRDDQPLTVYLRAEKAEIRLWRWARPQVEVATRLQRAFGWRVATDQDDAGVYIAARRRRVVGGLSTALFELTVPQQAYLMLKLDDCGVYLGGVDGEAGVLLLP